MYIKLILFIISICYNKFQFRFNRGFRTMYLEYIQLFTEIQKFQDHNKSLCSIILENANKKIFHYKFLLLKYNRYYKKKYMDYNLTIDFFDLPRDNKYYYKSKAKDIYSKHPEIHYIIKGLVRIFNNEISLETHDLTINLSKYFVKIVKKQLNKGICTKNYTLKDIIQIFKQDSIIMWNRLIFIQYIFEYVNFLIDDIYYSYNKSELEKSLSNLQKKIKLE